eukprot:569062-Pelagomonas_calceolata.AAC.2
MQPSASQGLILQEKVGPTHIPCKSAPLGPQPGSSFWAAPAAFCSCSCCLTAAALTSRMKALRCFSASPSPPRNLPGPSNAEQGVSSASFVKPSCVRVGTSPGLMLCSKTVQGKTEEEAPWHEGDHTHNQLIGNRSLAQGTALTGSQLAWLAAMWGWELACARAPGPALG